tara:strand:+ start:75 stop:284 length:210 start_codon:yes stop_codon:yes gene_type:complete
MKEMKKVLSMFHSLTEGMTKEETEKVYFNMAAIGLGLIHGEHGEQFYLEFIEGAIKQPQPIKINKTQSH